MTDFSALYKKYAPDVFRFALYLSGDRSQAEDLTSETFVRAWTSPEAIEVATVKAYLFTIARNLFLARPAKKIAPPRDGRRTARSARQSLCASREQRGAPRRAGRIAGITGNRPFRPVDEGAGRYALRRNFTGPWNFSFVREGQDSQSAASACGNPTCLASDRTQAIPQERN